MLSFGENFELSV